MHVQLDLDQGIAYLADTHESRQLLLIVSGAGGRPAATALLAGTGAGELAADDADHAWLEVGWLREKGTHSADHGWAEHFESLLRHADEHGWLSDDRTRVHAHVEWTGAEESDAEID